MAADVGSAAFAGSVSWPDDDISRKTNAAAEGAVMPEA